MTMAQMESLSLSDVILPAPVISATRSARDLGRCSSNRANGDVPAGGSPLVTRAFTSSVSIAFLGLTQNVVSAAPGFLPRINVGGRKTLNHAFRDQHPEVGGEHDCDDL